MLFFSAMYFLCKSGFVRVYFFPIIRSDWCLPIYVCEIWVANRQFHITEYGRSDPVLRLHYLFYRISIMGYPKYRRITVITHHISVSSCE